MGVLPAFLTATVTDAASKGVRLFQLVYCVLDATAEGLYVRSVRYEVAQVRRLFVKSWPVGKATILLG